MVNISSSERDRRQSDDRRLQHEQARGRGLRRRDSPPSSAPLGVRVSLIEPGNYGTEIGRNLVAHMDTSVFKTSRFAAQMRATYGSMSRFETNPPPDDVADAVYDAFTSDNPRLRYLVVPVEAQARIPIRKKFDDLVEMNEGQKFRYDRDALVKMLDDAIARAKAQR